MGRVSFLARLAGVRIYLLRENLCRLVFHLYQLISPFQADDDTPAGRQQYQPMVDGA